MEAILWTCGLDWRKQSEMCPVDFRSGILGYLSLRRFQSKEASFLGRSQRTRDTPDGDFPHPDGDFKRPFGLYSYGLDARMDLPSFHARGVAPGLRGVGGLCETGNTRIQGSLEMAADWRATVFWFPFKTNLKRGYTLRNRMRDVSTRR